MKSTEEIQKRIDELMADDRIHYPTATLDENAILAMVQVSLETELRSLCWVLGKPMPKLR